MCKDGKKKELCHSFDKNRTNCYKLSNFVKRYNNFRYVNQLRLLKADTVRIKVPTTIQIQYSNRYSICIEVVHWRGVFLKLVFEHVGFLFMRQKLWLVFHKKDSKVFKHHF